MYAMYEEQDDTCDFKIFNSYGYAKKIHTVMLKLYGGIVFKSLLSQSLKEKHTKELQLNYSGDVIEHFIAYLYLGVEDLFERLKDSKELDLFGLYDLALTYQIDSLIDCCFNLLNLHAKSINLEDLINFIGKFQTHDHTKDLIQIQNRLLQEKANKKVLIVGLD
ncbi:MAG: hypothetical protein K0S74_1214 [Chlamydiales bacterium]|jgi:hypothetical protein|nr:hypothetical protein [Chlamydiales bacterium]